MTTLHAELGASSSQRWMNCPGSVRLSRGMPNISSKDARIGSCAHAVGEKCLTSGADAITFLGEEIAEYDDIEIDEEMCESVQVYLDAVRGAIKTYADAGFTDHIFSIEQRLDLSYVYPEMFGTADAVIYFPAWKRLAVFDYKNGWYAVSVERNTQAMYYAVGALVGKHNWPIREVELVIVQPRTGQNTQIKRWECDPVDLLDFIGDLQTAARATERDDAPLAVGKWCHFCPARPKCPALQQRVEDLAMAEFNIDGAIKTPEPAAMPLDRLKLAWENAMIIEDWIKGVKEYAHQQAIAGNILPGCKLVEGRSRRRWKDSEGVVDSLKALQATGDLSEDIYLQKLKSPAQIETDLGKKQKHLIENLWEKGQGSLSLVPEEDERPKAKAEAISEFS